MSANVLSVSNVSFRYGEKNLLEDISFELAHGEFVSLVGRSGCGKSTLLELMAGDRSPEAGSIKRSGVFRRVHQRDGLFPWLTCRENIRLGLRGLAPTAKDNFSSLVEILSLGQHLEHFPHELSGGLRQRVELARALVGQPEGLFLDEPFSSLDYITRLETREYLKKYLRECPTTVVMVTHDIPEALFFSDRVLLLAGTPARVIRVFANAERDPKLVDTIWQELRS